VNLFLRTQDLEKKRKITSEMKIWIRALIENQIEITNSKKKIFIKFGLEKNIPRVFEGIPIESHLSL